MTPDTERLPRIEISESIVVDTVASLPMNIATDDDDENESIMTVPDIVIESVVPVMEEGVTVSVDLANLRPEISRVIPSMVITSVLDEI